MTCALAYMLDTAVIGGEYTHIIDNLLKLRRRAETAWNERIVRT